MDSKQATSPKKMFHDERQGESDRKNV